jgi:hypothetical protein
MDEVDRIEELRTLFLSGPVAEPSTRVVAVVIGTAVIAVVLWLVRRRTLREEYTPIWMGAAFALFAVSVNLDLLTGITRAIGAWTASSTIFFLGELFLLGICLNYAVRLSRTSLQIKNLAQEVALLRAELAAARGGEAPPGSAA